jgi:uncharacterized membrane protein YcaP (DUF421 family)
MDTVKYLLGLGLEGKELDYLQIAVRTTVVFIIALVYIRISGMRTIGKNTALDVITGLILGSVLSRAINGSAPFGTTMLASLVLVLLHRLLAFITYKSHAIGKLIKGDSILVVRDGKILWDNMKKEHISEHDLMEGIRKNANINDLEQVKEAYFERSGMVTVIMKD